MNATYATRAKHAITSGSAFTFHGSGKTPAFPHGRPAILTVEDGDVVVTCSATGRKLGIFSGAKKFWASSPAPAVVPAHAGAGAICRNSLSYEFAGEMQVLRCRARGAHAKCADGNRSWTPTP